MTERNSQLEYDDGIPESLRYEIEEEMRKLREQQRELSIIDDAREYWKIAGQIRGLKRVLGVRSYKDRWMMRRTGGFGRGKTGRCGYCGGTIRDKSGGMEIRLVCGDCGFRDEKDVS
jgi:hypothetical protein